MRGINTDLNTSVDQQNAFSTKVDGIETKVAGVRAKLAGFEGRVTENEKLITKVRIGVRCNSNAYGDLSTKVDQIRLELNAFKKKV